MLNAVGVALLRHAPAQLQGANLRGAQLQGADLRPVPDEKRAQQQGPDLGWPPLQGASLAKAYVWRVRGDLESDLTDFYECDPVTIPWTDSDKQTTFAGWRDKLLHDIQNTLLKDIQERLSVLDPVPGKEPDDVIKPEFWQRVCLKPRDEEHNKKLAVFLADLACSAHSAPYVARGLLRNGRMKEMDTQADIIVDRLSKTKYDPAACPGVASFEAADWKAVGELRPNQSSNK